MESGSFSEIYLLKLASSCSNFAVLEKKLESIQEIVIRLGVDAGGYEDRGVENLRCNLSAYLCRNSSIKAGFATACALLGLLPFDVETLLQNSIDLPENSSKFVSSEGEKLRKWFSGLDKDKQDLLHSILRADDLYKKKKL
ncbi:maternal effect embryo arrest protein [Senna tora]|uniref:Maternal effect embryo arrest protein n=1 Tax=Senna tora TaxID=362788 RepID=A0A834SE51_9FABA|nr:maternal effect embryo arrest protein [Senna tora]